MGFLSETFSKVGENAIGKAKKLVGIPVIPKGDPKAIKDREDAIRAMMRRAGTEPSALDPIFRRNVGAQEHFADSAKRAQTLKPISDTTHQLGRGHLPMDRENVEKIVY